MAGAWALVDQGKGGGGITDALTKIYSVGGTSAFNDVTMGNNGGPDGVSAGISRRRRVRPGDGMGQPERGQPDHRACREDRHRA